MSAAIETRGIAKRYGSHVALQDLTFAVGPGQIVGVLGPNGAGKTTAMRILTTILEPDAGSFSVAGIDGSEPAKIRARVGVLPESAGYPERQRAEEYLRFHARLFGHSAASARAVAQDLLEEVGLAERAGSPIATYSRGMRQRLGIARALVNEPAVVFLDEPTLGLDPAGQREILAKVRAMASERGAAVLLSTHLLDEVEENCSSVLILNRGRVVAEGSVTEIARRAAAPRRARIRVPPEHVERATAVLGAAPSVQQVTRSDGAAGWIALQLAAAAPGSGTPALNGAVRVLLDAGVPLVASELEGARLSDAFLAMTEEPSDER
ncbi:MAG: type transport system ATP-binding protein [bacterium]|jgi:ABC-2 type transport system ATP-binding protein